MNAIKLKTSIGDIIFPALRYLGNITEASETTYFNPYLLRNMDGSDLEHMYPSEGSDFVYANFDVLNPLFTIQNSVTYTTGSVYIYGETEEDWVLLRWRPDTSGWNGGTFSMEYRNGNNSGTAYCDAVGNYALYDYGNSDRYSINSDALLVFLVDDAGNIFPVSKSSYRTPYVTVSTLPESNKAGVGYALTVGFSTSDGSYFHFSPNHYDPISTYSSYALPILLRRSAPVQPSDPFSPGGTSEPGGGGGTFDDESDEIPDSSLPTLSAANTGFTRIYNPTLSQVQAMANYLWTDDTVIETIWNHIKQFLEDPMDAFIAFNLVPCAVPNGGTSNFKVMYIDTGVSMTTAANQFVDVDCGTVQLERYYGSALDYTPYTRIGCFLPYIGTVELDTDEVMGATLQVKYRIDIVSGACVAKIFVDGSCIYQYSGHCAINIPFTSADFSNYVNAIIQVAKAGLIAASGVPITAAGAGEAAEQLTGRTVTTTKTTQRNPATGRQIVTGTETTERDIYSTEASFKGLSPTNLANTVGAVMGSKPMIEHSGGFNGNSGYLGIRRPFLIIKRPRMCNPSGYGTLNGYPCMIKETLGNLSGFTQVQQVQLTGLSATNPEQAEILQLLKQGVIL